MATTEERLAALEAKMAQLTATRPTTYYTHQYSGEEIDNAVSRALPNGAIDQSVGTLVRPNLLDNWYFGRPVDQRGGKIVQQGKMAYRDAECTIEAGGVSETAMAVTKVSDTVYTFKGGDGNPYYVKAADVVRGYTDNWIFTVDRWSLSGPSSSRVLTIRDGAIHLQGGTLPDDYIFQRVPYVPVGEYCFSVLFRGNTGRIALSNKLTDMSLVTAAVTSANAGLLTLHYKLDSQLSDGDNFFRINFDGECDIIAAKLELGPTQTLAHQDAAGNWVLNEVPEYGEQLRRCQRYHYRLKADSSYMRFGITQPYTDTSAGVFVQLMSTMRTKPVVSYGGNFALFDGSRFYPVTLAQDTTSAYNTVLKANGTGLPGSSAQLLANADTNAYIDFSADL